MIPRDISLAGAPWRRVAIVGDSIAQGVREPVDGWPDRSWTDRILAALPGARELNLGRRGAVAAEIRAQQLDAALAFRPDLAIVAAGANDALGRSFAPAEVEAELDAIVAPLRAAGADVLLTELFDLVAVGIIPARHVETAEPRFAALAALTRRVAVRRGALLVENRHRPADPSLWASDRLHLNAKGHALLGTEALRVLGRALAVEAAA